MNYNPQHISPPDNPHAIFCDFCGEQIFPEYSDHAELLDGVLIHTDCLPEAYEGLQRKIKQLENEREMMVSRGMN